jgi:hypothetical protein
MRSSNIQEGSFRTIDVTAAPVVIKPLSTVKIVHHPNASIFVRPTNTIANPKSISTDAMIMSAGFIGLIDSLVFFITRLYQKDAICDVFNNFFGAGGENRTLIVCLEGRHISHYTTPA